jgi:hypothetical protein
LGRTVEAETANLEMDVVAGYFVVPAREATE